MSCDNKNYLPQPPREWSRVQNSCSVSTEYDTNALVQLPYSKEKVPIETLGFYLQMLNKGNVLQYKNNSGNLTFSQKYSKIAKGQWVNRNTTWAIQGINGQNSNPNSQMLKRTGNVVNIAIDPITGQVLGPTTLPVTCPQTINVINNALPSNVQTSLTPPPVPPPKPSDNNYIPYIPAVTPFTPLVIQDGGSLVCSIQENPCTGETVQTLSQQLCNLTTDSDVPGPIEALCWNDGTPTWYPKQNLTMDNSTNKWPYSSGGPGTPVLRSAIQITPPTIVSWSQTGNIVNISWKQEKSDLPITYYNIYKDDILVETVPNNILSYTFYNLYNCTTYFFYVRSGNYTAKALSVESNIVATIIECLEAPTNVLWEQSGKDQVTVSWDSVSNEEIIINYYKIYVSSNSGYVLKGTSQDTTFVLQNAINETNICVSYVTNYNVESPLSEPSTNILLQPLFINITPVTEGNYYYNNSQNSSTPYIVFTATNDEGSYTNPDNVTEGIKWNFTITYSTTINYLIVAGGGGGGIIYTTLTTAGGGGGSLYGTTEVLTPGTYTVSVGGYGNIPTTTLYSSNGGNSYIKNTETDQILFQTTGGDGGTLEYIYGGTAGGGIDDYVDGIQYINGISDPSTISPAIYNGGNGKPYLTEGQNSYNIHTGKSLIPIDLGFNVSVDGSSNITSNFYIGGGGGGAQTIPETGVTNSGNAGAGFGGSVGGNLSTANIGFNNGNFYYGGGGGEGTKIGSSTNAGPGSTGLIILWYN